MSSKYGAMLLMRTKNCSRLILRETKTSIFPIQVSQESSRNLIFGTNSRKIRPKVIDINGGKRWTRGQCQMRSTIQKRAPKPSSGVPQRGTSTCVRCGRIRAKAGITILMQLMLSVEEREDIDTVTRNPGDIIRVQRCIWRAKIIAANAQTSSQNPNRQAGKNN